MYEKEEQNIRNYKEQIEKTSIPNEALDDAIMTGFQRAKGTKLKKKKRSPKWIMSLTAAAILLVSFIGLVKGSPVFAQYITAIPGMEKIVELIRNDKGMMSAIEHDYYQEINVTKKHANRVVTLDGVIADQQGLVLFYTIKGENQHRQPRITHPELKSTNHESLDFKSISLSGAKKIDETTSTGTIEIFFDKPYQTREFILDLQFRRSSETMSLPFTLKKEMPPQKTYELNQTVVIEKQKIEVLKAVVNPLRTAIHVKAAPENTKEILDYEDVRLVDERGETWGKIMNGTTGSRISDTEQILYLQSNYFHNPKELYLVFNKMQAVHKKQSEVVIDVDKEEIISQPKGNKLRNLQIKNNQIEVDLHTNKEFHYSIFGKLTGANGNETYGNSSTVLGPTEQDQNMKYSLYVSDLDELKSPITMDLSFFPAWIEGNEKVRIK
ncbi:DUF4179 domain-containing protein [Salinibacillus xinjiangensis]|uniref:DUF4179 domain-containing protein n=1 Tax=Salinibacillus xinjiangensis TaxID=1229268 RepID=A0A6G1X2W9_9BACI|nr:DUF4179 domain-containing protein [Salinibacillus xinjiangensis]MRG85294.1 DUF4179 domain-containing protein [Salinibacillus xinjiangensis]